ncbi:MAG TPA: chorismate mutase [Gaiellaceae bacterium]|nr:chorismate mutase [Gaiellaceae bacterium]
MSDELADGRARISANDERIVALVNERLRLVAELWEVKRRVGADQIDPQREQALLARLQASNQGPLSAAGLEHLVRELLDLTKRELGARDGGPR